LFIPHPNKIIKTLETTDKRRERAFEADGGAPGSIIVAGGSGAGPTFGSPAFDREDERGGASAAELQERDTKMSPRGRLLIRQNRRTASSYY
jgi:hypothetical protein